jgi:hypothetical protein
MQYYPTPKYLLDAYQFLPEMEQQELLQNLPLPLNSGRVGTTVSKAVWHAMTAPY